jgi:hypothetical protein
VGPIKIRLPLVHYPLELVEAIQALIMFVVGLALIPLLQQFLGVSFEAALAFVIVFMATALLPTLFGVPFTPGWITPAIPLVILYLSKFEPGVEAAQALVALHLLVAAIFLFLGVTKLAGRLVKVIPASVKGGIIIGAGIAAIVGEIREGGRFLATPFAIGIGTAVIIVTLFSVAFKALYVRSRIAASIANYGLVPGMLIAAGVGWAVGEIPRPDIQGGFSKPAWGEMWELLPFSTGFPAPEMFLAALPTAIIAYIIAYGDIVVGTAIVEAESREDEYIDINQDRVHVVTGIRNLLHGLFNPNPGQGGPIWTALVASVAARYAFGRKAMESIYSGTGTFYLVAFAAMFIAPLVTFFQPTLPVALSLTLLITGYLCLMIGMQQVKTGEQMAVAGITGVVLATHGAEYGLATGIILYFLVERASLFPKATPEPQDQEATTAEEDAESPEAEDLDPTP